MFKMLRVSQNIFIIFIIFSLMPPVTVGKNLTSYYRQFIEAEDCELSGGFSEGHNVNGGYIGDRFVFAFLKEDGVAELRATLPHPVPTGKAKVFVRTYCSDGNPMSRMITVNLGEASASLVFPNEMFTKKHNDLAFEFDLEHPADEFVVLVKLKEAGRIIIDSILVTTDPGDELRCTRGKRWILRSRCGQEIQTARSSGSGNLLVNSSFEVSPTNGWRSGYSSGWSVSCTLLDNKFSYHGDRSLRVDLLSNKKRSQDRFWNTYNGIWSGPIQLKQGSTYTVSAHIRANNPCKGSIGIDDRTKEFSIKPSDVGHWHRIWATIIAPQKSGAFFITFSSNKKTTVWLDAIQLKEGQLSEYHPDKGVDVGISYNREGAIFREGEPISLNWDVRARSTDSPVSIKYLIHGAQGEVVAKDKMSLNIKAGVTVYLPIKWNTNQTGAYRIAYRVSSGGCVDYRGQRCFAVIPKKRGPGEGPVGFYASNTRQCFSSMANAGVHWTNTLSPAGYFGRWFKVEPEQGHFVFHDDDIALAQEFSINILGNINVKGNYTPQWILQDKPGSNTEDWIKHPKGYFPVAAWAAFVEKLVGHYKDKVKYWLLTDEPDHGYGNFSAKDYAKLVRAGYQAAKRANPNCYVLAHMGTRLDWRARVLARIGSKYFDGQYTYIGRFGRARVQLQSVATKLFPCPLWTVDFGMVEKLCTYYANISAKKPALWDKTAENTRKFIIWAIQSLSWGKAEKWFRYDARYPGPQPGKKFMSLWEHDGSLTPHGVSTAAMNALIADARPEGEIEMPMGMEGHLFVSGQRRILITWTTDGSTRRIDMGKNFRAWDVYGKRIYKEKGYVPVFTMPTFIEYEDKIDFVSIRSEIVENISARLLPPDKKGDPYRAEFTYHGESAEDGEWVASGPYFLGGDCPQRNPCFTDTKDRLSKIVYPLNLWPGMKIHKRQAVVKLYLQGRILEGKLGLDF